MYLLFWGVPFEVCNCMSYCVYTGQGYMLESGRDMNFFMC